MTEPSAAQRLTTYHADSGELLLIVAHQAPGPPTKPPTRTRMPSEHHEQRLSPRSTGGSHHEDAQSAPSRHTTRPEGQNTPTRPVAAADAPQSAPPTRPPTPSAQTAHDAAVLASSRAAARSAARAHAPVKLDDLTEMDQRRLMHERIRQAEQELERWQTEAIEWREEARRLGRRLTAAQAAAASRDAA